MSCRRRLALLALAVTIPGAAHAQARPYDAVILNRRVIDPESGLDAVRSVGIREPGIYSRFQTVTGFESDLIVRRESVGHS
jgi:hypothetical protein